MKVSFSIIALLICIVNATKKADRKKNQRPNQSIASLAPQTIQLPLNQQIMNACGTRGYLFTDPPYARLIPSFHMEYRFMDMLQLNTISPHCSTLVTDNILLFPHLTHLYVSSQPELSYFEKMKRDYRAALRGNIRVMTIDFLYLKDFSWFFLGLLDDLRDDDVNIDTLTILHLNINDLPSDKVNNQLRTDITRKLKALGRLRK